MLTTLLGGGGVFILVRERPVQGTDHTGLVFEWLQLVGGKMSLEVVSGAWMHRGQ